MSGRAARASKQRKRNSFWFRLKYAPKLLVEDILSIEKTYLSGVTVSAIGRYGDEAR
jgi:hypothetical protein